MSLLKAGKFKLVPISSVVDGHQQPIMNGGGPATSEDRFATAGEVQLSKLDRQIHAVLVDRKLNDDEKYERYLLLLNQHKAITNQITAPKLKANPGAQELVDFVERNRDKIKWNENYALMKSRSGSPIPDSEINDLINEFSTADTQPESEGAQSLLDRLLELEIDPSLVRFLPKHAKRGTLQTEFYDREKMPPLTKMGKAIAADKKKRKERMQVKKTSIKEKRKKNFKVDLW
jgi:hypothetical protein